MFAGSVNCANNHPECLQLLMGYNGIISTFTDVRYPIFYLLMGLLVHFHPECLHLLMLVNVLIILQFGAKELFAEQEEEKDGTTGRDVARWGR